MRRAGGAWAVVCCVAALGCAHNPFRVGGPLRPFTCIYAPPTENRTVGGFGNAFGNSLNVEAAPGLYVESVLYERPLGDPLINRDIWVRDVSAIPPQTRVLLEENGLKVAVIGGNLPPDFLRLLESAEGAVNPQSQTFGSRSDVVIPTVGPIPSCEFAVRTVLSADRETRSRTAVHGGFRIQPEKLEDGTVKVLCEPQIQHGERQDFIRPAADATGFTLRSEVPHEDFPTLGFKVKLNPGDYLVIGWPASDEGETQSLGSTIFCVDAKGEARQRVLVLRAGFRGGEAAAAQPQPTRSIAARVGRE